MLTADTSVVVPALASWHERHEAAFHAVEDVSALPAQVVLEAAAVLTRLPHGLAQPLSVVADVLREAFPEEPLALPGERHRALLESLADAGISGGAVYDGVVGETAIHHGATLISLDDRAAPTYRTLGVTVQTIR